MSRVAPGTSALRASEFSSRWTYTVFRRLGVIRRCNAMLRGVRPQTVRAVKRQITYRHLGVLLQLEAAYEILKGQYPRLGPSQLRNMIVSHEKRHLHNARLCLALRAGEVPGYSLKGERII